MKKGTLYVLSALFCFGILVLSGCSGGGGASAPTTTPATTTLSTSLDAGQSVVLTGSADALPAGVLATSLTMTPKAVNEVPAAPVEAAYLAAVDCGPAGIQFSQPVTLTFKLSPARTAGEVLTVYYLSGGAWIAAGTDAIVSNDGLTASATISHFSTYGLFAPVNAALPGDKFFTFAGGVNNGGSPSEIMYNDVAGELYLPHASALQVTQAFTGIKQAPYGVYRDSNGATPPTFPATVGTVYVMRSIMTGTAVTYYKLQIVSATTRTDPGSTNYGVVTFSYAQILPLDIVNAVGRWLFPDGSQLAVLPTTIAIDYTAADSTFYTIDGNYTNRTTLAGNFMTSTPATASGAVTVTLSLTTEGKLNATLNGGAPLGSVTLTGGSKQ